MTSLDAAVREHPDLVRRYFMTRAVPVDYNKFTALHAALWSGGVFIYVPKNVEVALPVQGVLYADAPGLGVFGPTVIVAAENALCLGRQRTDAGARRAGALRLDAGACADRHGLLGAAGHPGRRQQPQLARRDRGRTVRQVQRGDLAE